MDVDGENIDVGGAETSHDVVLTDVLNLRDELVRHFAVVECSSHFAKYLSKEEYRVSGTLHEEFELVGKSAEVEVAMGKAEVLVESLTDKAETRLNELLGDKQDTAIRKATGKNANIAAKEISLDLVDQEQFMPDVERARIAEEQALLEWEVNASLEPLHLREDKVQEVNEPLKEIQNKIVQCNEQIVQLETEIQSLREQ
ncbi:hypothetical protein BJ742DRAFT_775614 [Cladochytrium replicatum]|nr:hypothetical protein BJ742DRAFT_775614 [Cladochytrium replicatum]